MIRESYTQDTPTSEHVSQLSQLIALSAQELSKQDYSHEEIEAAIAYIFGVDTQLIVDKTYFFITHSGQYCACGGWSYRSNFARSEKRARKNTCFLCTPKLRSTGACTCVTASL